MSGDEVLEPLTGLINGVNEQIVAIIKEAYLKGQRDAMVNVSQTLNKLTREAPLMLTGFDSDTTAVVTQLLAGLSETLQLNAYEVGT